MNSIGDEKYIVCKPQGKQTSPLDLQRASRQPPRQMLQKDHSSSNLLKPPMTRMFKQRKQNFTNAHLNTANMNKMKAIIAVAAAENPYQTQSRVTAATQEAMPQQPSSAPIVTIKPLGFRKPQNSPQKPA